ncbi:MAG: SRPBCC domain-containing protein [Planctomycetota bacterium]|jgi:hypothetical protein
MRYLWLAVLVLGCASKPKSTTGETIERDAAVYIAAEYDEIWMKLTTAEEFASWYSLAGIAFPHDRDKELQWGPPGRVMIRGTLRWIEKGKGFAHSFQFRGLGFDDEPESEVVWDVTQQGPVVLVRVRHTATDAPETMKMIGELGWAKSLNRLKTLLETGTPMAWPGG